MRRSGNFPVSIVICCQILVGAPIAPVTAIAEVVSTPEVLNDLTTRANGLGITISTC